MKKNQIKKYLLLLIFLVITIFTSCSNNAPQIQNARFSVVFDYAESDSLPNARLSIFVEATSNPRRFDTIIISCDQNEYVWEANDLVFAADVNNVYCGITNIVMPADERFPSGEYTITFRQSDDEQKEIKRMLSYDKNIYNTNAKDIPAFMKKYYGTGMLTVYNAEKTILYYGPRSDDLMDARGIWNNFRDATEFQESWVNQNGTVICNLPIEKVTPGN